MRTLIVMTMGLLFGFAGNARAQFGMFSAGTQPVGTPVGTPVGRPPSVGSVAPLGTMPLDTRLSVAPVAGTAQGESYFSAFYNGLARLNPFRAEQKTGTTGWFPSMGRRNRTRHKDDIMPVWLLD